MILCWIVNHGERGNSRKISKYHNFQRYKVSEFGGFFSVARRLYVFDLLYSVHVVPCGRLIWYIRQLARVRVVSKL